MTQPILSHKKTKALTFILFLVGLAIISFFDFWWPGIMLVIGIPLAVRQFFFRNYFDVFTTLLVFLGVFIAVQFHFQWKWALPILFILGAIYILFRDFIESKEMSESEREEDINEEIEEEQKEKKK